MVADGTPYWSARDLAKLFGYSEWRNFADAIRKARQQVAAHNIADQGSFVDATVSSPQPNGGFRAIPDVHLTRFAAYFVALNADQSKPEVRAEEHAERMWERLHVFVEKVAARLV